MITGKTTSQTATQSRTLTADLFVSLDGFACGEGSGPYFDFGEPDLDRWIDSNLDGPQSEDKSMPEQPEVIVANLLGIATAEGTDLSALLKVTIFVTTLEDLAGLRMVLAKHCGSHLPASSLVVVSGLFAPTLNIEIEAVLALDN